MTSDHTHHQARFTSAHLFSSQLRFGSPDRKTTTRPSWASRMPSRTAIPLAHHTNAPPSPVFRLCFPPQLAHRRFVVVVREIALSRVLRPWALRPPIGQGSSMAPVLPTQATNTRGPDGILCVCPCSGGPSRGEARHAKCLGRGMGASLCWLPACQVSRPREVKVEPRTGQARGSTIDAATCKIRSGPLEWTMGKSLCMAVVGRV